MIRLSHLSGSMQGGSSSSPKAVIRIGRGADCDVRYTQLDAKVSTRHAEIRFEAGDYYLVDTGSSNGTLVNGKQVTKQKLREGDKLTFGAGGPEARFELDRTEPAGTINSRKASRAPPPQVSYGAPQASFPTAPHGQPAGKAAPSSKDTNELAEEAKQRIARARAEAGGESSGSTMFIMADTLNKVQEVTQQRSSRRYGKIIGGVVLVALCVSGGMAYVIYEQNRIIGEIVHRKDDLDKKIQKLQLQMQIESDPGILQGLEEQLTLLTGKAQQAIGDLAQRDKEKASQVAESGDELDREIKRILKKFDANTYAIPPIFKERLQYHIDRTIKRSNTKLVWGRKRQYWPAIIQEFSALGLPEEMAYVAWTESQFDPMAQSPVGARGMWQFMPGTARTYGLRVDDNWRSGGHDDRTDVPKLTHAAAKYLANLLAEFGSDSFMLAIASYNKGEGGMRKVLHDIAQEPGGFRKEKRDFWHLYRLKKLPEETLEYVPQILAAAIIGNNPQKYGLE